MTSPHSDRLPVTTGARVATPAPRVWGSEPSSEVTRLRGALGQGDPAAGLLQAMAEWVAARPASEALTWEALLGEVQPVGVGRDRLLAALSGAGGVPLRDSLALPTGDPLDGVLARFGLPAALWREASGATRALAGALFERLLPFAVGEEPGGEESWAEARDAAARVPGLPPLLASAPIVGALAARCLALLRALSLAAPAGGRDPVGALDEAAPGWRGRWLWAEDGARALTAGLAEDAARACQAGPPGPRIQAALTGRGPRWTLRRQVALPARLSVAWLDRHAPGVVHAASLELRLSSARWIVTVARLVRSGPTYVVVPGTGFVEDPEEVTLRVAGSWGDVPVLGVEGGEALDERPWVFGRDRWREAWVHQGCGSVSVDSGEAVVALPPGWSLRPLRGTPWLREPAPPRCLGLVGDRELVRVETDALLEDEVAGPVRVTLDALPAATAPATLSGPRQASGHYLGWPRVATGAPRRRAVLELLDGERWVPPPSAAWGARLVRVVGPAGMELLRQVTVLPADLELTLVAQGEDARLTARSGHLRGLGVVCDGAWDVLDVQCAGGEGEARLRSRWPARGVVVSLEWDDGAAVDLAVTGSLPYAGVEALDGSPREGRLVPLSGLGGLSAVSTMPAHLARIARGDGAVVGAWPLRPSGEGVFRLDLGGVAGAVQAALGAEPAGPLCVAVVPADAVAGEPVRATVAVVAASRPAVMEVVRAARLGAPSLFAVWDAWERRGMVWEVAPGALWREALVACLSSGGEGGAGRAVLDALTLACPSIAVVLAPGGVAAASTTERVRGIAALAAFPGAAGMLVADVCDLGEALAEEAGWWPQPGGDASERLVALGAALWPHVRAVCWPVLAAPVLAARAMWHGEALSEALVGFIATCKRRDPEAFAQLHLLATVIEAAKARGH